MTQWLSMGVPEIDTLRRELAQANSKIVRMHSLLMNARRHAYMASAMERCRLSGSPPRGPVEFRAQFGEDCLLYELFEGMRDGFFVEAGAFNGVDFSVSYAFEQLGWTGLLVEAIPERAEECRHRRPHSHVVHAALGAPGGGDTVEFTAVDDQYGGMLSRCVANAQPGDSVSKIPGRNISVPLRTLDSLLEGHSRGIDFLSLDLEGGEAAALEGFDLVRYRPKVLLLEDMSLGRNSPVARAMEGKPYALGGWVEMSAIYICTDHIALMERFARMSVFGW